jgi:hypothetical protein
MFLKQLKSLLFLFSSVAFLLIAFQGTASSQALEAINNEGFGGSTAFFKSKLPVEDFVLARLTKEVSGLSPIDRFTIALNPDKPVSAEVQTRAVFEFSAHVVDALIVYDAFTKFSERLYEDDIMKLITRHFMGTDSQEAMADLLNSSVDLMTINGCDSCINDSTKDFDFDGKLTTDWTSGMAENTLGSLARLKEYSDAFEKALKSAELATTYTEVDGTVWFGTAKNGKGYPEEVSKLLKNQKLKDGMADGCSSLFCSIYTERRKTEDISTGINGKPNESVKVFTDRFVKKFEQAQQALVADRIKANSDAWQERFDHAQRLTAQQQEMQKTAVRCLGWDSASPPNCIGGWN